MKRTMTTPDYLRLVASLDNLERCNVSLLQADGRRPFSRIAREVGVTEKTAHTRVLDLIEQGGIHLPDRPRSSRCDRPKRAGAPRRCPARSVDYADLYYKRPSTISDETILRSAAASQGLRPCTISFSR
jgi:hypothetical protein